ncbi:MAG: peptide chain release factor N(5)-glutamine methyltransferase [Patescibacteria group bacterium]|jgi:release factor glutamine methyltransferase
MRLPLHEIDLLLAHVLNKPREFIYSYPNHSLTKAQTKRLNALIKKRQHGIPLAYLTGHKEFYGLDFFVTPAVLIPRPDTELLIDTILQLASKQPSTLIDIGTGSGNIAVTLKKHLPHYKISASDISLTALKVAKKNAKLNNTNITFYKSNLLNNIPKAVLTDCVILVANLPYLTKTEAKKRSLMFEPQLALTPPQQPTSLIHELIQQTTVLLKSNTLILLEIGYRQSQMISRLVKRYYPQTQVKIRKDLGKFDRIIYFYT